MLVFVVILHPRFSLMLLLKKLHFRTRPLYAKTQRNENEKERNAHTAAVRAAVAVYSRG